MRTRSTIGTAIAVVAALAASAGHAQQLRFGLAEDPDVLDPTLARTFVGRVVFAALCDKLFDIDEKLNIVPQLATGYEWSADRKALTIKLRKGVTFHDGEKLDAAAAKLDQMQTGSTPQDLQAAQSGLDSAQAKLDHLVNPDPRDVAAAQAAVESAQASLTLLQSGGAPASQAQTQALVDSAQATLRPPVKHPRSKAVAPSSNGWRSMPK